MKSSIASKSFIKFLIYVIIFIGIIFFLLNPALDEIEKSKKTITDERKALSANYDEIASLQKIAKEQISFNAIKNTVLGYLPGSLNSSQFIVELEGLAKNTDITINNFSMNATSINTEKDPKKKKKSTTQQNDFSLNIKADFAKTMSFVAQMEKLSRFNSISTINITSTENNGADVTIKGSIYYEQQ